MSPQNLKKGNKIYTSPLRVELMKSTQSPQNFPGQPRDCRKTCDISKDMTGSYDMKGGN